MNLTEEQLKEIEMLNEAYEQHDSLKCRVDCCIFCYMGHKEEIKMTKTRAKFECTLAMLNDGDKSYKYRFNAVVKDIGNPDSENSKFFKYTPAGELTLDCSNEHAFTIGKEYYIDIMEA